MTRDEIVRLLEQWVAIPYIDEITRYEEGKLALTIYDALEPRNTSAWRELLNDAKLGAAVRAMLLSQNRTTSNDMARLIPFAGCFQAKEIIATIGDALDVEARNGVAIPAEKGEEGD